MSRGEFDTRVVKSRLTMRRAAYKCNELRNNDTALNKICYKFSKVPNISCLIFILLQFLLYLGGNKNLPQPVS